MSNEITPSTPSAPSVPSAPSGPRIGSRPPGARPSNPRFGKKLFKRKKVCRFCADKIDYIDFKNANLLRNFITDRGKMISAQTTGVCTSHQRNLTRAIKRARVIALLPFAIV